MSLLWGVFLLQFPFFLDYGVQGLVLGEGDYSHSPPNISWVPELGPSINLPVEDCDVKDAKGQENFAELLYLNMTPSCDPSARAGYCGVRRHQNISLIAKFVTKTYNDQLRVRVHLVDKNFGFETAVWPEFGACHRFFNISCPQEPGLVHSYVFSEMPKEIPPLSAIVRVRLVTVAEDAEKNTGICRQIKLQVM